MPASLHPEIAQKEAEAPFRALHQQSGSLIECTPGSIVRLGKILGKDAAYFAREHLLAESNFRQEFLQGERHREPGAGHSSARQRGWTFQGLRRVTMLDFAEGADHSSDLALHTLGLEKALNGLIRNNVRRMCPKCKEPLSESISTQDLEELLRNSNATLAVCIPYTQNATDFLSRGYDTCIRNGKVCQLESLEQNQLSDCWLVLDAFSPTNDHLLRLQQAGELASSMHPQKVGVFSIDQGLAREERTFIISSTCSAGHFTADEINLKALGRESTGAREVLLKSCVIEGTNLLELLSRPLTQIRIPTLKQISEQIRRFTPNLLSTRITLLTPVEELALPDIQALKLLKLLIECVSDSVLVIEEPLVAADQECSLAFERLCTEIASSRNRVLIIDSSSTTDRAPKSPGRVVVPDPSKLKHHLAPGRIILNWSRDSSTLEKLLSAIDGRELTPPAAILRLPGLKPLHASNRSIAELVGLMTPLTGLYQQLPLAKRYGLSGEQLFNPPSRDTIPLFKGISPAQALQLTVEQAHKVFGQIPACARTLEIPAQLGLGSLHLNHPASRLSLGELNRLRLSQINIRPAKLRRIYVVDYPLCGLDSSESSLVKELFNQLTSAGHTLLVTDRNGSLVDCCDECLKFESQEATV